MFESIPQNYPLYMSSAVSRLSGSMSKSMLKIVADRTDATPSTLTSIRLPIGSLLNAESLCLNFKATTSGPVTFPTRYASSFIKRLSITINNNTVQIINDYSLLYNVYADHNSKNNTKCVGGENFDNSIQWTEGAAAASTASQAIVGVSSIMAATPLKTYDLTINNWLGLFGSASTSILSTSKLGEIIVSIEWAPASEVLGGTAEASAVASGGYATSSYALTDIHMTAEALSFSDNAYYQQIEEATDLKIAFDDFVVNKFASVDKKNSINVTSYVSAGSIEHVFGTAIPSSAITAQMIAFGSEGAGSSEGICGNTYKYLADPIAYSGNTTTEDGDNFFTTKALQRNLQHIESSQFAINNKQLNFGELNKTQIFQNNLCALGYLNGDASSNGFNSSILSLAHYYKYYGACFQSLSLIDRNEYYISGLSSAGSSAAFNWVCKFGNVSQQNVTPVLVFKINRVLHVGQNRNLYVE